MNRKQLHKHSIPVVILGSGLIALSLISFQPFKLASNGLVGDALHTHLLSLKPSTKLGGSALEITVSHMTSDAQPATTQPKHLLVPTSHVGQAMDTNKAVQLDVTVDQQTK